MTRGGSVRLGVAGLGRMGVRHARNAAATRRVELVAVADPDEARARSVAAELGVAAHTSVDRMVGQEQLDALVVATPPPTHLPLVELAARQGVHVLCEKPLSHDGPAAAATLALVETAGIKLQIGFQMRFDADFMELAEMIAAGRLGRVFQFRASLRDATPPPRDYLAASGGYFWDGAIHLFDLARWLVGEIVEVASFAAVLSDPLFEELGDVDNAMVVLRFDSGALGLVETSRVAGYGFESGIEILGERATCRVPGGRAGGVDVYEPGEVSSRHMVDFLERFGPAYPRELDGFVDCVLGDESPRIGGADGLAAMRICAAAVASHRTGRSTSVASVGW
jgi:predicted dehydrogenase